MRTCAVPRTQVATAQAGIVGWLNVALAELGDSFDMTSTQKP